jgi:hypothetical protein
MIEEKGLPANVADRIGEFVVLRCVAALLDRVVVIAFKYGSLFLT